MSLDKDLKAEEEVHRWVWMNGEGNAQKLRVQCNDNGSLTLHRSDGSSDARRAPSTASCAPGLYEKFDHGPGSKSSGERKQFLVTARSDDDDPVQLTGGEDVECIAWNTMIGSSNSDSQSPVGTWRRQNDGSMVRRIWL